MKRILIALFAAAISVPAQNSPHRRERTRASTQPAVSNLARSRVQTTVVIRLTDPPLAGILGANAKRAGTSVTRAQQQAYLQSLVRKQDQLASQVRALGGREVGRVSKLHNALIVEIQASQLNRLASLPGVKGVRPLGDYKKALDTTVPYVRAAALHGMSVTGANIKVAVLDSGVDYTHRNLGGPGTVSAYIAAYGASPASPVNKTRDSLFPTPKVYDGFDFVGEVWPNGPRAPDPDPIDFEGHGTHVADIIAGRSSDNTHKGVAPDAKILAVKVCSSVATNCSGLGILLGLDFAIDPNGDGDLSDAVDVINLSLGSDYGQREDDLSEALRIASLFGIVVVTAAGNAADRPYIVDSPSTSPAAISVANTQVPGTQGIPLIINSPASIAGTYPNTETLDFAPIGSGFSNAQIVFVGRGCPADSIGQGSPADTYLKNPAGKVALIDRGACNVSAKIDRAAEAGAIGVLIGLVAPGDAVGFSLGGGDRFVPSLVITQDAADLIKGRLAAGQTVRGTVTSLNVIPLAGSVVTSSSRGPGYSYNSIKPDIAAPGASRSAEVGTGNGETSFSGTSGAAPMVAGAAALLLETCPRCSPVEIKARLMNAAETNIFTSPKSAPGELAPITRIGAGELRVDRSSKVATLAWDAGDPSSVSLAFGSLRLNTPVTLTKKVLVRNLHSAVRTYSITPEFRYAEDAGGAVSLSAPPSVMVPANGSATFLLTLSVVNPSALPVWSLNGGSRGGDGFRLKGLEFDGYVKISDTTDTIRVPWHFLPHKASEPTVSASSLQLMGGMGQLSIRNTGVADGLVEVFSLLATSPRLPANTLPRPGDNFALVDLRAVGIQYIPGGGGPGLDVIQFGLTTWGERSHPNYPAEFDVFIDIDGDSRDDYVVFTGESGGFAATGQNITVLQDLRRGPDAQTVRFFTTADLSSANTILPIFRNDLLTAGGAAVPAGTKLRLVFCAGDNYFTGLITDCSAPVFYTLGTPRFTMTPGIGFLLPSGATQNVVVSLSPAGNAASPSQLGFLLLYADAKTGKEAEVVMVNP